MYSTAVKLPCLYVHSEDGQVPVKKRGSSKKKRQRSQCEEVELESPKFRVMFRQPPSGEKRVVYLDPRQPKHGFRLEVCIISVSVLCAVFWLFIVLRAIVVHQG